MLNGTLLPDVSEPFLELITQQGNRFFFSLNGTNQTYDPQNKDSNGQNYIDRVKISITLHEIDHQSQKKDPNGLSDMEGGEGILLVLVHDKGDERSNHRDITDDGYHLAILNCLIIHHLLMFKIKRLKRLRDQFKTSFLLA
jgi:hypothetical protein